MIWLTIRKDISPGSLLSGCCIRCRALACTYASYGTMSANSSVGSPPVRSAWAARCPGVTGRTVAGRFGARRSV